MAAARTILILITALVLAGLSGAARAVTRQQQQRIDEIAKFLQTEGPQKTFQRYFGSKTGPGLNLVETGDPEAVKIAVALLPATDGGNAETLHSSLATALARNPRAVLPYVDRSRLLSREQICIPFLPLDIPNADAKAQAALDRVQRAVESVHEPALAAGKAACLEAIADYRRAMQRTKSRTPAG